jgi:hypothetical protein
LKLRGGDEIEFYSWEIQQLELMVKRSIKELEEKMKEFEAANQAAQLRSAQGRLKRYLELLEKIRAL